MAGAPFVEGLTAQKRYSLPARLGRTDKRHCPVDPAIGGKLKFPYPLTRASGIEPAPPDVHLTPRKTVTLGIPWSDTQDAWCLIGVLIQGFRQSISRLPSAQIGAAAMRH